MPGPSFIGRWAVFLLVLASVFALVTPFQTGWPLAFSQRVGSAIHAPLFAEANREEDPASPSGGIMSMKSLQSQLASAFTALDESDQYNAVLTGLCAKILDQPSALDDSNAKTLEDPIQLVEEMNSRRIRASPRSLMAFIDVSSQWSVS